MVAVTRGVGRGAGTDARTEAASVVSTGVAVTAVTARVDTGTGVVSVTEGVIAGAGADTWAEAATVDCVGVVVTGGLTAGTGADGEGETADVVLLGTLMVRIQLNSSFKFFIQKNSLMSYCLGFSFTTGIFPCHSFRKSTASYEVILSPSLKMMAKSDLTKFMSS